MLRGLLGFSADGLGPRVPADWDSLRVENLRWRDGLYDFEWTPEAARLLTRESTTGSEPVLELRDRPSVAVVPVHEPLRMGDLPSVCGFWKRFWKGSASTFGSKGGVAAVTV